MEPLGCVTRPCYSMRLLVPFAEALREHRGAAAKELEALEGLDLDDRVPIEVAHEWLRAAVRITGAPHLGLQASRRTTLGDAGAVDYVMSSCGNVRDSIAVSTRYMRLINDALDVHLDVAGDRAVVRFHNGVVLPRAAEDFQLGALFQVHWRSWLGDRLSELQVRWTHRAPEDLAEYERTFAPASLRFGAPHTGFEFPRALLEVPLRKADPKLHGVLREHADRLLAELPPARSLTGQVRSMLATGLGNGQANATEVAKRLGVSTRTLTRKLEREGTSLKELADDLRRRLALQYVGSQDLPLSEVALLLGFSQTSAFHRAFRRWTGQTPLEYRRSRHR